MSPLTFIALALAIVAGSVQPASAQVSDPICVRVVVNIGGATLFTALGDEAAQLSPGARVTALARSVDGLWLQVADEQGAIFWAATDEVVGFGLSRLPVVDPPTIATSEVNIGAADESDAAASTPALNIAMAGITPTAALTTTAALPPVIAVETPLASESEVEGVSATVITGQQRLNVRSGPGESSSIIAKAVAGERLSVIGRSDDGAWLAIQRDDLPDGAGWVASRFVTLESNVQSLPILPWSEASVNGQAVTTSVPTDTATNILTAAPVVTDVSQTNQAAAPQNVGASGLSGNLVFQDGRGSIYVYDPASSGLRWLTVGYGPDVSADGSQVVFTRTGEESGIWAIDIDGADLRLVYSSSDLVSSPKWSTDGEWIVFSRLSGVSKCYQMGPTCVTMSDIQAQFPQLTPEMIYERILANSARVETPLWGLARVSASGGDYRDIPALNSARSPDWSSAGIVYQSSAGLEITADSEDARSQSVFHGAWDWDPDWAQDGGQILYQEKAGSHWEIWRVNSDGSGRSALTRPVSVLVDALASNVAPAWSPDGTRIVFLSNRSDGKEPGAWRLWVMDADGGNQRALPIDVVIDYAFAGEQVVSWGAAHR